MRARSPRPAWVLTLLALIGAAAFLGFAALGVWQVQRLAYKRELIARVDRQLQAAPVDLPSAAQWPGLDTAQLNYLPVRLSGRWLPDKTVLTQAVTELGAGAWVMTALQLPDGAVVLVNRGFVPQGQVPQAPAASPLPPTQEVLGLLRMSEPGGGFLRSNDPALGRWHSRDVAAIAHALSLPRVAPFFVDAGIPKPPRSAPTSATEAESGSAPAQGPWPRAGMTVVRFHNSHLAYALTWFGLALMVAAAAALVARYELRLRKAHRETSSPTA